MTTTIEHKKEMHAVTCNTTWDAVVVKRQDAKRLVTAVVLTPERTDAQGDIMSREVIEQASYNFMMNLVKQTSEIGYMHKIFGKKVFLVESYIAPSPLIINGKVVSEGAWIMTVKVVDDDVWQEILSGKVRGFSISGKAVVTKV